MIIKEMCQSVFEDEMYQINPALNSRTVDDMKLYQCGDIAYYVPRVTKLLDTIKEDYLLQWANSLGWKRQSYTRTLDEYAKLGSRVHEEIEEYLRFGTEGLTPGWTSFKIWWDELNKTNTVTDVMSELELIGPYFGGTTDLFCKINGYGMLVDFKTSKHIGYKYVMQLAAYRYLMMIVKNIDIRFCVILQVDKYQDGIYHTYIYDTQDPAISQMFRSALEYIHVLAMGYLYNSCVRSQFDATERQVKDVKDWRI